MKRNQLKTTPGRGRDLPAFTVALMAAGLLNSVQAATLETAGEVFVNVDVTQVDEGLVTEVANAGSLGGSFQPLGAGRTIPRIIKTGGTKGIRFDGSDYLQLADSAAAVIPPPEGLVGPDPTRTIEVWALNPSVAGEETLVSWGKRGGGDGSNISFNYGSNGAFGAIGHWGGPDIGWNNAGGNPEANKWHHLVYTYDGTTTRVYSDGVKQNEEVLGPGRINTHANTAINLATQLEGDGVTPTPGLRGSLTIARVRIHDDVLTDEQVAANYNTEKADFIDPAPVEPPVATILSAPPANRYSFSEVATDEAQSSEIVDSIGGVNGVVVGAGASFSGTRLVLPGGPSSTAPYADFPNGLISSRSADNGGSGEITLEGWIKITGVQAWSRIFDIGSTTGGELEGPGGGGSGLDYLLYSAMIGTDSNSRRFEYRNEDPAGGGTFTSDVTGRASTFNTDLHWAVSWNEATGDVVLYENGREITRLTIDSQMSELNDVNVWLGRSNWTADSNTQGEYDEFRVYNRVLAPGELLGNYLAGADTLNQGGLPVQLLSQPSDVLTSDTYEASFAVTLKGSPPLSLQWYRNGQPIAGATDLSVRVPVTLADSGAQFFLVASNFANGVSTVVTSAVAKVNVTSEAVALKHRYSFNEAASDTTAVDSVSGANGEVMTGGAFTGSGRLVLDGATGYVNLPNDLVMTYTNITVEAWVQDDGSSGWARIFDFGNSSAGEDFTPGAAGAGGTQYMFLSQPSGFGTLRGAYTATGGGGGEQLLSTPPLPTLTLKHVAWVSHRDAHTGRLFVDGALVASNTAMTLGPSDLGSTVNNWLGRAQFNDPFFKGQYEEFRIYQGAMTPSQVAASFAAGPDASIGGGDAPSIEVTKISSSLVQLSWPESATGYALESSASVGAGANWQPVTGVPAAQGGKLQLSVPLESGVKFFRLRR